MSKVEIFEINKIIELLETGKHLKPKTIAQSMLNQKRELDTNEKIKALRESKSIPPEYLDLLAFPEIEAYKNIITDTLLQIFTYISSTHSKKIVLSEFKTSKKSNINTTSLNQLYTETKSLLKLLKSAAEVEEHIKDKEKNKLKKGNILKDEFDVDNADEESSQEKIKRRKKHEILRYLQFLKEARASIAAEGMK